MILLWKRRLCPSCPSFERSGGNATAFRRPCLPLPAITVSKHYLPRCLRSTVTCGRGKMPNIVRRFDVMLLLHNKHQQ